MGWWVASRGWGKVFVYKILMVTVGRLVTGTVGGCPKPNLYSGAEV